MNILISI